MNKKRYLVMIASIIAIIIFSVGCNLNETDPTDDGGNGGNSSTVIDIAAIPGVTAPVQGATPVTTITETDQYTGTVSWSPSDSPFAYEPVYTATITLTAKSGYTLTGVTADFFTVAGATSVTNDADSGVVTAVFPATGATPPTVIDIAAIPGVTAPVQGATPVTTITETDQYTGTVSWSPSDSPFAYETVYTATITLTAKRGYTLTGVTADFFTVTGADSVSNDADSGVVTAVFPENDEKVYAIGDTGPAGGLIFYIDTADDYTWTYLEVAPSSTEWIGNEWGDYATQIGGDAALTGIGEGQAATTAIVSHMEGKSISDTASQLCDALSHNGFEDWFLPSKDELNAIWDNLVDNGSGSNSGVGGFALDYYWSSSEYDSSGAWLQIFYYGYQYDYPKASGNRVRAVRAF